MTDITELALITKIKNQLKNFDTVVLKEGEALALVEALEKAQAAATQQGNIASALFDEVTQLRRHADEKAPELRAQLIEADSELEALRQRIAELESFRTAYMEWSDKTYWVNTDRRFGVVKPLGKHRADVLKAYIEHLESRAVTVEPFRSFVTDADLAALHRFAECCDDPESGGHDLEKEQVLRLEAIGALRRSGCVHWITGFGDVLISITSGIKWEAE